MKFKNLSIIGGGPNAVYALDILLKNILKEKIKSKKKFTYLNQLVCLDVERLTVKI